MSQLLGTRVNVEFLSKYGIICEYAKLTSSPLLIMVSGTFAPATAWNFIDDGALGEEGDAAVAVMLATTGLAVAKFETLDEIDAWIGDIQSRLDTYHKNMSLLLAVVDAEGNLLEEDYLPTFPTTYLKGRQTHG